MRQPYAKVTVGAGTDASYTFTWGDRKLRGVSVTLSEGKGLSNCSFSVYDEDRTITDAFMVYVKEIEGLEPIEAQQTQEAQEPISTSGDSTAAQDIDPILKAVLDMIAWAEGTSTISRSDNGYNVLVGGDLFNSYADHPRRRVYIPSIGDSSSAAGRYQFLDTTWDGLRSTVKPLLDTFEPHNQDRAAIQLLKNRNAYDDALNQNWATMLDKISYEWASLPASDGSFRYPGQGLKTPQQIYDYLNVRVPQTTAETNKPEEDTQQEAAVESTAQRAPSLPGRSETLAGQQITLWLGFDGKPLVAYSFIHTSLAYSLYDESTLEFGGTAAAWVMNQAPKNSAYTNLTLKQLAEKITANYGLQVDMQVEGPKYVYIQQKAMTDYEFLLKECNRVGLIIKNVGNNTLEIKAREETLEGSDSAEVYTLSIGENLSNFSVSHQAQKGGGGARSAEPGEQNSTGVKKFFLNPDTGEIETVEEETADTKGGGDVESTTGSNFDGNHPLTTGLTDLEDQQRKANEQRVRGIEATYTVLTTPEALVLTPDDPIRTNRLGGFLNRIWVHASVTHALGADSGFTTTGKLYTPLRNKYPQPGEPEAASGGTGAAGEPGPNDGSAPSRKENGFIKPVPSNFNITSPFGLRNGRQHRGADFAIPIGTPIWASKEGTVATVVTSCPLNGFIGNRCGGGFGNYIVLNHTYRYPNGNTGPFQTVYAHLHPDEIYVSPGDPVKQGELIAKSGNSGSSSGPHLHAEIRESGIHRDPAAFY